MLIKGSEVKVGGFYSFILNGENLFEAPSKNLITDFGWSRLSNLAASNANLTICQVGTSNTPPATTDTALGALLAQVTGNTTVVNGTGTDVNGNYTWSRITFAFAQGAVIGNVAEVGFKVVTEDSGVTSRSLVKDGLGNPAVIVCTAIDQLTVLYELRYYRSAFDVTTSLTIGGVSTTVIFRDAGTTSNGTGVSSTTIGGLSPTHTVVNNHYGTGSTFGAVGVGVSGTATTVAAAAVLNKVVTVNPTNTTVTFSTSVIGTSAGNSTGGVLNALWQFGTPVNGLGAYGSAKANFSPIMPKDNTKTVQYSFSYVFTRL